jgi:hypothetical protein
VEKYIDAFNSKIVVDMEEKLVYYPPNTIGCLDGDVNGGHVPPCTFHYAPELGGEVMLGSPLRADNAPPHRLNAEDVNANFIAVSRSSITDPRELSARKALAQTLLLLTLLNSAVVILFASGYFGDSTRVVPRGRDSPQQVTGGEFRAFEEDEQPNGWLSAAWLTLNALLVGGVFTSSAMGLSVYVASAMFAMLIFLPWSSNNFPQIARGLLLDGAQICMAQKLHQMITINCITAPAQTRT